MKSGPAGMVPPAGCRNNRHPILYYIMAKSKGFFGLRSGSTKNFTFSELNGAQITKERVYKVKNPRTMAQMRQRMLMTTVGAAYSYLKVIADHSFEGKTVGQQCMGEFMRVNLNKFREGAQDDNAAYAFNSFKDKLINPMRYILSAGSLPEMPFVVNKANQIELQYNVGEIATAKDVYDAMGIKEDDLITFVWVVGDSTLAKGVFSYTPTRLNIVRLRADKVGAVTNPHDAFTFDANHSDLDINVTSADGVLKLTSTEANFGAVILSRKTGSQWLRSNSAMAGNKSIIAGVTVGNQLNTYPIESELILNGGEMSGKPSVTTLPIPELSVTADSVTISTKGGTSNPPTLQGNDAGGAVSYSISNPKVATIDPTSGKITAVANGTAVATIAVGATETTAASTVLFNVVVTGQDTDASGGDSGSGTLPGGGDSNVGL